MRILGELCLLTAFVGSGYAAFACLFAARLRLAGLAPEVKGHRSKVRGLSRTGIAAAVASFAALTATLLVLARALLFKDYDFEYVAHYTSRQLPWHYSLAALWVGQAGSLLLWTWMLALLSLIFLITGPGGRLQTAALAVLLAAVWFLTAIMVFAADPMKAALATRLEGLGLSPLLQHPRMLIHPPVVFLAYAAWTVPFALATSALASGELDARWTHAARPWALFAWIVLAAGLLLGADWAYQELGWGGYWGWDPVENGSLLPWLTGTALIHSLMAWRHRGCLKRTAVSLAIVTFGLCNFATFLTRSGIFSSVHAFSQSPIGWMFLGLLAVLLAGGSALLYRRWHDLAPDRPFGGLLARESLVVVSVYLLLLLTAVVLVGTLYTPLSKLFLGRMVQIGSAFYNNAFVPAGVLLLAATAIVPLLRWGRGPRTPHFRALLACLALAAVAAAAAPLLGVRRSVAIAVASLAVLAASSTAAGVLLDIRRQKAPSLVQMIWLAWQKYRRQYGGYLVHLAFASVAIGVTGSSLGSQRHDVDLDEGQTLQWAGRRIEAVRLIQREEPEKLVAEVELLVSRDGCRPIVLKPARHYHILQDQWTSEVAIHSTWAGDFYVILHAGLGGGRVALTFIENPMMRWIWFGGWLAAIGAAVAAWPKRRLSLTQGGQLGDNQQARPGEPQPQRRAA